MLLIESFENSNRIVAVGREATGLRSDFVLKTDLRDFHAEYDGDPARSPARVQVRIAAKLVRMPRRLIVAGDTFEAEVKAESPAFSDAIKAFDHALDMVMRRIVEWTLRQGAINVEVRAQSDGGVE